MHNFNDNSLPYDNLITAQILDAVELELMDKASAHGAYDEKTEAQKKQTATSHKLRVEIVTDIDKTKTLLTAPAGSTLDMSFVDTIWLKIIELTSNKITKIKRDLRFLIICSPCQLIIIAGI